ncbi:nuclear transport factor 2 family protein [Streptomyces sp. SYSU K217416]
MKPLAETSPAQFIGDFFTSFTEEVVRGDEDPGPAMDRYYTPDIVQISDGIRLDRDRLIAHIRPVRRNLVSYRVEVHEAVADGDRIAARFTMHAQMRKAGTVAVDVHLFGELAPDGRRFRRTHQITRTLPQPAEEPAGRGR